MLVKTLSGKRANKRKDREFEFANKMLTYEVMNDQRCPDMVKTTQMKIKTQVQLA